MRSGRLRGAAARLLRRMTGWLPDRAAAVRLADVLDALPGFVGLLGPDGTVIDVNHAAFESVGPGLAALRGRHLAEAPWWAARPEAPAKLRAAIARAAAGHTVRTEAAFALPGGAALPVDLSIVPVINAEGRVTHLVAASLDLGEHRRTEARLRERTARLRTALDGARLGLWEWDTAGRALLLDRRASEMLGGAAHRWVTLHGEQPAGWLARVHPDDRAALCARLHAAEAGPRWQAEYRVRRQDGGWIWLAQRGAAVSSDPATGRPLRIAGILQDITAHRAAEATLERQLAERGAALRASERRFERLVQSVTDCAIFMLDMQGRVTSWNAGAQRIKGYAEREILGRSYGCFYSDEDRAAGLPEQALATAMREGRYEAEGWRLRQDGTRFWASVVIEQIADDAGAPAGFAKITRDVTARREMQRRLAQAQKMEAVGQLTGGIAHDFNNLLQAVSGNLELARSAVAQGGTARADRLIGNAQRAIDRGGRLTAQLLAFSRRQVLHAERCLTSDLARDMADLLARAGGDRGPVVTSRRARAVDVPDRCRPVRIRPC